MGTEDPTKKTKTREKGEFGDTESTVLKEKRTRSQEMKVEERPHCKTYGGSE